MEQKPEVDALDQKQFEVAIDVAKQLLTLATVVITITVSFWKDVASMSNVQTSDRYVIGSAWVLYLFSILFGMWCLYAINGSIAKPTLPSGEPRSIYSRNVAFPMAGQQLAFLLAIIATVVFGIRVL